MLTQVFSIALQMGEEENVPYIPGKQKRGNF
jgi:hypothetical protein